MNEPSALRVRVPWAGAGDQDGGQRVAVGVGVVGQHAGRGDGQRGVLGGGVGVGVGDRGVVDGVTVIVTVAGLRCWVDAVGGPVGEACRCR